MRGQYQHSGTVEKYLDYLKELHEMSCVESTFNLNSISQNHNVTRVIGTVVKHKGILTSHPTRRSTYKWTAAKPTITMARKIREAVVEYNNRDAHKTTKKKTRQTQAVDLFSSADLDVIKEEKVPFFSLKIGRLKISF
jgi:hypothetical protein